MNHKTTLALACLLAMAPPAMAAAGEENARAIDGAENCQNENYGVQANTYLFVNQDCSSYEDNSARYYNFCDSHTGGGVAAGSGGANGSNPEASGQMEMTAGTQCYQTGGDPNGAPQQGA